MEYNQIEGVGKPVARLLQGTVMLRADTRAANRRLLDRLFEHGYTCFDTAHNYGGGDSTCATTDNAAYVRHLSTNSLSSCLSVHLGSRPPKDERDSLVNIVQHSCVPDPTFTFLCPRLHLHILVSQTPPPHSCVPDPTTSRTHKDLCSTQTLCSCTGVVRLCWVLLGSCCLFLCSSD